MSFYVVGGVYADTTFTAMKDGGRETRLGPFATHDDAKSEWSKRAWSSVDDALARWRIEQGVDAEEAAYWVVGGVYTSTEFTDVAGGAGESWEGPFADLESAKAAWSRLAWTTVDDALARWRIERRIGDPRG